MNESNYSQPAEIRGPALTHARTFSAAMGGLAGGATGGIFGYMWGMAGHAHIKVRALTLAAIGAAAGVFLSNRTFTAPMRLPNQQFPAIDADFAPGSQPASPEVAASAPAHAARIAAERATQADVSQAL